MRALPRMSVLYISFLIAPVQNAYGCKITGMFKIGWMRGEASLKWVISNYFAGKLNLPEGLHGKLLNIVGMPDLEILSVCVVVIIIWMHIRSFSCLNGCEI